MYRERNNLYSKSSHTYQYKIGSRVIDATQYGSWGRYMNHSCVPNSYEVYFNRLGVDPRIKLFTKFNIPENTELTYNYSEEVRESKHLIKCCCGSGSECTGFMGFSKTRLKEYLTKQKLTLHQLKEKQEKIKVKIVK